MLGRIEVALGREVEAALCDTCGRVESQCRQPRSHCLSGCVSYHSTVSLTPQSQCSVLVRVFKDSISS